MNGTVAVREQVRAVSMPEPATVQRTPQPNPMLALQRTVGNQAVASRLAGTVTATGFDPNWHVDRLQTAIRKAPFGDFFLIDRDAVAAALAGLTEEGGREVRAEYRRRTSRDLGALIIGDDYENNLSRTERKLLLILLHGTAAPAATQPSDVQGAAELTGALVGGVASLLGSDDPEGLSSAVANAFAAQVAAQQAKAEAAAATRRYAAEATMLESALQSGKAETVLALIRRPQPERQDLAEQYERHFRTSLHTGLVLRLNGRDFDRAMAIWRDDFVTADRLALERDIERQEKAEAQAERFEGAARVMPDLAGNLTRNRLEARAAVEARLELIGGAAEPTAQGRESGRAHLEAVLAQPRVGAVTLRSELGVGWNRVITAIVEGDEPEVLATRLARADAEGSLKQADLEGALRQLRGLARRAVVREVERDPTLAARADELLDVATVAYYERFRTRFDDSNPMRSLTTTLAKVGGEAERERNLALLRGRGAIEDWQELDFALRRKPKDIDTVRRVLGSKTKEQVDELAATYWSETGRFLQTDLLGTAQERLLEEIVDRDKAREAQAERRELLQGGVFVSNAPDEATRLAEEGRWTFGRIAALERRVMENRGLFAEFRDWMGNIEHELVKRARDDAADAKTALDIALTESPADLSTARTQLAELRKVQKRLEQNVVIYKEATAAAFNEFVDLAVFVITTAITLGQGSVLVLAVRATAATIGTKLVLKGGDYLGSDEFWNDLRNGVANAAGGKAAEGMFGPLAARLATTAQKTGLTTKLAAQRLAVWEASNIVSTGVSNVVAERDVVQGMGVEGHVTNVAFHQAARALQAGRALSTPAPPGAAEQRVAETAQVGGRPPLVGATGLPLFGPPVSPRPLLDQFGRPIGGGGGGQRGGGGEGGGVPMPGTGPPVRLVTARGEPVLVSGGRIVAYPGRTTLSGDVRLVDPGGRPVSGPPPRTRSLVDVSGRPLDAPQPTGPTIIDLQSGTGEFLHGQVGRTPQARGIGVESGDWLLGYQRATPTDPGDLELARAIARNAPVWPDTPASLTPFQYIPRVVPWELEPGPNLWPERGPVRVQQQPFFPPVAGGGRLIPLDLRDVRGITATTHPQLHGTADQIYLRRPFGLATADSATTAALGRELNQMLRPGGFVEFRGRVPRDLSVPTELHSGPDQLAIIAAGIEGATVVRVDREAIRAYAERGVLPDDPIQAEILRNAAADVRGLGAGDYTLMFRIYKNAPAQTSAAH